MRKIAAALIVGLAGLIILFQVIDESSTPLNAQSASPGTDMPFPILSVSGTGKVTAAPDIGLIQIGVLNEANDAGGALAANTRAMAEIFAALEARNIAARDIQTNNLSISPIFARTDRPREPNLREDPRIIGYRVQNNVNIKIRDLDAFGAILDELVRSGANTIQNIRFGVDDPQALLDEARAAAMKDANRKATILAGAGAFSVGPIVSVTEGGGGPIPQFRQARSFISAESAVPVAGGELTFTVNVSVSYGIENN